MTLQLRNCPDLPILIMKQIYAQSVTVSMEERIEYTQTKGGWVEEHWPAQFDTVRVETVTGGFFLLDATIARKTFNGAITKLLTQSTGLASSNVLQPFRRYTNPAQTAAELEKYYRLNGSQYGADGQIERYRPVVFTYMNFTFYGYFENFVVDHTVENVHMYNISFDFKVQHTVVQPNRNLLRS